MRVDLNYLHRVRADDAAFFDRFPDREFRLRRAHDCEYAGEPPTDHQVFVVVHRHDVGVEEKHHHFGARRNFNTALGDAEIRELLT